MALEIKPDLILLDIIMPIMDGITAFKKIRASKDGARMPVIILTNLSEGEKLEEAKKIGAHDYLIKSDWSLDEVVKKIKKKLNIK